MFVCFVYITPYLQFSEKRCNYLKLIRNPNQIEPHKDITHLFPCATDTRVLKHNIYSLSRARSCREHCATGTGTQLGPRPLGPAASFRKALRVQMSPTIAHAHFISFFKFLYVYTFNLILWTYTHKKKTTCMMPIFHTFEVIFSCAGTIFKPIFCEHWNDCYCILFWKCG